MGITVCHWFLSKGNASPCSHKQVDIGNHNDPVSEPPGEPLIICDSTNKHQLGAKKRLACVYVCDERHRGRRDGEIYKVNYTE